MTLVSFGPNSNQRFVTTYFRRAFHAGNAAAYEGLLLRLLRDDGAIVYLNGVEILRDNLVSGLVSWNTLATTTIDGTGETTPLELRIDTAALVAGTNVIAVEVHQASITSSDLGFNLALVGLNAATPAQDIYLTQPGTDAHFNTPAHVLAAYATAVGGAPQAVQYYANGTLVGSGCNDTAVQLHLEQRTGWQLPTDRGRRSTRRIQHLSARQHFRRPRPARDPAHRGHVNLGRQLLALLGQRDRRQLRLADAGFHRDRLADRQRASGLGP